MRKTDIEQILLEALDEVVSEVVVFERYKDEIKAEEVLVFCQTDISDQNFKPYKKLIADTVNQIQECPYLQIRPIKDIQKAIAGTVSMNHIAEGYEKAGEEQEEAITPLQQELLAICRESLKIDHIGINDNLSLYGIDSLRAVEVYKKIEELYPDRVKLTDLYSNLSIKKMEQLINSCEFELENIILPTTFFVSEKIESIEFEYTFDSEMSSTMIQIAEQNHLGVEEVLLAAYAYLFHQITNQDPVTLQVLTQESDDIKKISFDFGTVSTYTELLYDVKTQMKQGTRYMLERVQDYCVGKKDRITPVFLCGDRTSHLSRVKEIFDMVFSVYREHKGVNLYWSIQHSYIHRQKITELAENYIHLVAYFMEQLNAERDQIINRTV